MLRLQDAGLAGRIEASLAACLAKSAEGSIAKGARSAMRLCAHIASHTGS
jgi:hypothetical protein